MASSAWRPAFCCLFLQEVVGLSFDKAQPPLQLQMARAVLLLGALQLYRFCFLVGCLAVRAMLSKFEVLFKRLPWGMQCYQ